MAELGTETTGALAYRPSHGIRPNELEEDFTRIQKELRDKATHSTRFNENEKAALQLESLKDAEEYCQGLFGNTLMKKSDFDQKHSYGAGSAKRGLNNAAASVHDTLNAMSPIIDVIKDSGMPFAGSAVGAITFVFAVAKNRQASEERINKMLWAIKDRFLGLKLLGQIYKSSHALDDQIRRNIIIAYNSFAIFLIAVIEYYDSRGFKRSAHAMGLSTSLDDKAASAQDAIEAVRLDGNDIVHKSLYDIQRSNDEMHKKLDSSRKSNDEMHKKLDAAQNTINDMQRVEHEMHKKLDSAQNTINDMQRVEHEMHKKLDLSEARNIQLMKKVQELQNDNNDEKLEKIRTELGVGVFFFEKERLRLGTREGNAKSQFPRNYLTGKTISDRLAEVERDGPYSTWRSSAKPSVLVLAGRNQVLQGKHCWLSPIAISLVKKLEEAKPPELFAYQIVGDRGLDDTFEYTLASIVCRLLSRHPDVLSNKTEHAKFWIALQGYKEVKATEGAEPKAIRTALRSVVLKALNMFEPGRTVWVVLDRLDQCQCAKESRYNHRKEVLRELVYLAEDQSLKVNLRVLVVVNSVDWNIDAHKEDYPGQKKDSPTLVIETIPQWKLY